MHSAVHVQAALLRKCSGRVVLSATAMEAMARISAQIGSLVSRGLAPQPKWVEFLCTAAADLLCEDDRIDSDSVWEMTPTRGEVEDAAFVAPTWIALEGSSLDEAVPGNAGVIVRDPRDCLDIPFAFREGEETASIRALRCALCGFEAGRVPKQTWSGGAWARTARKGS